MRFSERLPHQHDDMYTQDMLKKNRLFGGIKSKLIDGGEQIDKQHFEI